MRILQVLPAFNTGGVEEGALAISNALQQGGHQSVLVSAGGSKVSDALSSKAKHITLPLQRKNPFRLPSLIKQLSQIIKEHDIDIVHARSRWPAWAAFYAAKRNNVPFMTTFHGVHKTQNKFKALYNSVMVQCPHVISVSDFITQHIKQTYSETLNGYQTQLHTIPRGIDTQRFNPENVSSDDVELLRKTWKLNKVDPVILLPARITRLKGHHILIDALAKLKHLKWKAILVGSQAERLDYQKELENKIQTLNLTDKIKIVAAIQHMPAAYYLSDIVVFPSTQPESFGRIVIESQAMGKPIITANIGAQATLVKDGKTGWLFETGNAHDLATKIKDLLGIPKEKKAAYAQCARQNVLANYTQDLMCQKTLDLYEKVLNQSK